MRISILVSLLLILLSAACKQNECADVPSCVNGACVEGECLCNEGWEGGSCDTPSADKFAGTYSVTDLCNNAALAYASQISKGSTFGTVLISVIHDENRTVSATVHGDSLYFTQQAFGTSVFWGSGFYSTESQIVNVDYYIDSGLGDTTHCLAAFRP